MIKNHPANAHRKNRLSISIGLLLGGASLNASAALTTSSSLDLVAGGTSVSCAYSTGPNPGPGGCAYHSTVVNTTGSWFAFDHNGNTVIDQGEITLMILAGTGAVHLGSNVTATGSHSGSINGTENPAFNIWEHFGHTGMHYVDHPITEIGTHTGTSAQLDFSGWTITWAGIPKVDVGGGTQDCGTTSDGKCGTGANDIGGVIDNGTGIATITCSQVSCSDTSTYILDYTSKVAQDDPSNFGGVTYWAHLEGTISSAAPVPIPAAAWLFGSGLVGLASLARRKNPRQTTTPA